MVRKVLGFIIGLAFAGSCIASMAIAADSFDPPPPMQQWLNSTSNQGPLPIGTTITPANWQQYKRSCLMVCKHFSPVRIFGKCRMTLR
jgi:Spy/CpxP family protein refolding chaperone